jgi:hypothetical protein
VWFRVEDVRALSYDHTMTLDWFDRRLGRVTAGVTRSSGGPYTSAFDPAASVLHQFPIVVEGPTCAELFAAEGRPASGRWADAPDAVTSRPVQRARAHLAKSLAPGLWRRLDVETTDLLANAWVERGRVERDEDVDPRMGFTRIACAVENELCARLIPALERLCDRLKATGSPVHAALAQHVSDARPSDSSGRAAEWTLGTALDLLKRIVNRSRRDLVALKVPALLELATNVRWLEDVNRMRNSASHGGRPLRPSEVRKALFAFFDERGEGLRAVVDARDDVEGASKPPPATRTPPAPPSS